MVVIGAVLASLWLILGGSLLLGAGNTAVMLGRYAAADLLPETARVRAMATVLVATTVGAVAGPNLLAPASNVATQLGLPALSGPYFGASIGFAAAAATLALGLRAAPSQPPRESTGRTGFGSGQRRTGRRQRTRWRAERR